MKPLLRIQTAYTWNIDGKFFIPDFLSYPFAFFFRQWMVYWQSTIEFFRIGKVIARLVESVESNVGNSQTEQAHLERPNLSQGN